MPNASAASEAQQWQWERCRWLHVAPCTCEVSREWCVWVQPALNARIHFTPRFESTLTHLTLTSVFFIWQTQCQSLSPRFDKTPPLSAPAALGPFPWAHRTISILHPRLTSRGMRAQRPLKVATEGIGRSGRTAVLAPLHTLQPSTSMGLEVSDTERMRARIGPAHSFSPPCSAHATDPCSRA